MTSLPDHTDKKLGLVIDLDTCVGCHACVTSCKEWNASGYSKPLTDEDAHGADPHDTTDPRPHALIAALFGCLEATIATWAAGDGTEPLPRILHRAMNAIKGIAWTESVYAAQREWKTFAATDGSVTEQTITHVGAGIEAHAVEGDEHQRRSYPDSGGGWGGGGYEIVRNQRLKETAGPLAEASAYAG